MDQQQKQGSDAKVSTGQGSGVIALLCSLCLLLAASSGLRAQVGSASLSGVVEDTTGAVIPGASTTLRNLQTSAQRTAKSNSAGTFSFPSVPSGDYTVTINMPGFSAYTQTGIHLNPGDNKALSNIKLEAGAASQTVTVSSTVAGLPLDSGQLSSTITANDLDRLSIVGRDATELQRILPGFAIRNQDSTNQAPDFSQVTIGQPTPYASNGAPVAGITLKLDGANLTDAGNFGANLQNINDSFVSEVQVQTSNFGADQSNGPVVIQAVTKSGTANYHGSLYTFARTNQLNSNDWLAKYNGLARPSDRFVFPGFTFSGPVPRYKKLTFFGGAEYDAQRNVYAYNSSSSAIIHALVPTAAMRAGDFSQASLRNYLGPNYSAYNPATGSFSNGTYTTISRTPTVGSNGTAIANGNIAPYLDKNAVALINGLLPLPNEPTGADGFNYIQENLVSNNITQIATRVDYALSPRNTLFGRYSFEKGKQGEPQIPYYSPNPGSVLGGVNTPGFGVVDNTHVHSGAANYVAVFTPTLTNELYATLEYTYETFDPKNAAAVQKSTIGYGYNGIFDNGSTDVPQLGTYAAVGGLPLALVPDFSLGPLYLKKFQPSVGDNLTKVLGTHTIKVGVFSQRISNNQSITNGDSNGQIRNYYFPDPAGTPGGNGAVGGNSYGGKYPDGTPAYGPTRYFGSGNWLANFFEGQIQTFDQQSTLPHTDVYFWNTDFYGQDTWRVNSRLVLNYGMRFEHLGAWTDADGIGAAVFTPSTIATVASAKNPFPGFQWHAQNSSIPNSGTGAPRLFFEPRVGFSADLLGGGKTVLRGGFGEYRFHDSETDVNNAFLESRNFRTADLQGFGNNTLSGIDSVHQNPATFGFTGTQTSSPIATVYGLDSTDNTDPVTRNYSLSLAQQLPKGAVLQISYVGNASDSLLNNGTTQAVTLNNLNAVPVGYLFTPGAAAKINKAAGANACNPAGCTPQQLAGLSNLQNYPGQASVQAARTYPEYGSIIVPHHNTFANYNAVQVEFIKQVGRLNFNANYTFSKALGILGGAADFNFTAPLDPFNIYNNYGPENFDRSQILNLSYSYQVGRVVQQHLLGGIANGWLISGITNLQSGGNMQTGISFSPDYYVQGLITDPAGSYTISNQTILGTPDVSLQPTLKCDPRSGRAAHQYLNGSCFGLPALGTNGQRIEPYTHGPAFFNTDLTLEKGFSLGKERKLRFRYAAFNFINHPLNSFGTGYASQTTLILSGTSPQTAAYNPSSGFGFAPLKIGRRLSEVSLRYDF